MVIWCFPPPFFAVKFLSVYSTNSSPFQGVLDLMGLMRINEGFFRSRMPNEVSNPPRVCPSYFKLHILLFHSALDEALLSPQYPPS